MINTHTLNPPQMIEVERSQVKDLRGQGYADRQLQEMGFCEAAVQRAPSVAAANAMAK